MTRRITMQQAKQNALRIMDEAENRRAQAALAEASGSVTPTTDHPKKWAECLDCGSVTQLTAFMPMKLSCCSQCGSLKIRLYKPIGKPPNCGSERSGGQ